MAGPSPAARISSCPAAIASWTRPHGKLLEHGDVQPFARSPAELEARKLAHVDAMTMALHEQSVGATSEWYTPRYIFTEPSCTFDVDVASPGQDVTTLQNR